jgi:hypothetical protein
MLAVDRGAALLDARLPGWRDVIDASQLDLNSCQACVLGQLFGDYSRGLCLLDVADAEWYGFYASHRTTWQRLTAAWHKAVER